ncbi:NAD(P)/FAD-dependent oxidoreductase [Streptomyces sp. NPDC090021]|uniref:NAD(P)/FAD-dependent oxidoreductase n=1 Tax=Streptomyces sp. NPDC090021 TaxID=3365919 RepID=UPI003829A29F
MIAPEMYDVVVVGARCAGAPTAMGFARAGYRVLLLDRMRFPSDVVSTQHIHRPGLALLDRWGLFDRMRATGCPPMTRMSYSVGEVTISGVIPASDGIDAAYAPRRFALDDLLARAAVEAGAELHENCTVREVLCEDGRATGVRYQDGSGRLVEVRAHLVVGADGMRSTVARLVGARTEHTDPTLTCAYYAYWEGLPTDFEIYERTGALIAALATNDDRTLVVSYLPQERFAAARRDPEAAYLDAIRSTAPALAGLLPAARRVGRLRGTGSQLNFFRQASGPGWALVGDAGCHKDSVTGTGITDAFEQAELLVAQVGPDLADRRAVDGALARFAAGRGDRLTPRYRVALDAARLEVPDDRVELMRWISNDQPSCDTYLAIAVGLVQPADYPAPAGAPEGRETPEGEHTWK